LQFDASLDLVQDQVVMKCSAVGDDFGRHEKSDA
jgi:hypothetical protein